MQGRKLLTKEEFGSEFFGMCLHVKLVHGLDGRCIQLRYRLSIYYRFHLKVYSKLMFMPYFLTLVTKFIYHPYVECMCYTRVSLNVL
jgi:hypothetical protein